MRREEPLNIPIERRSPNTGLLIFLSYHSVSVPIAKPKASLRQEYWCLENLLNTLNILNKENGNDDFDIVELESEMVHTLDLSKE